MSNAARLLQRVADRLGQLPACLAGSGPAFEYYDLDMPSRSDIDVFCFTQEAVMAGAERLLADPAFQLGDRAERVYARWLKYGMGTWHTNSLKLVDTSTSREVNLVYKTVGKHPAASASQVIETFDWGLLHSTWDLSGSVPQRRSAQEFLFPDTLPEDPLPLMPSRREDWLQGFMSQYQALRAPERYVKYHAYGFDMSLVREDLTMAYTNAAFYLTQHPDEDRQKLGQICARLAVCFDTSALTEMEQAVRLIPSMDSLDEILGELS